MAINEVHVGDVGTKFDFTVLDQNNEIVDVSGATVTLRFCKPDGTILSKATTFITDGTDGQVRYVSVAGDLDVHGEWRMQLFVDFGTNEWYSSVHDLTVFRNVP